MEIPFEEYAVGDFDFTGIPIMESPVDTFVSRFKDDDGNLVTFITYGYGFTLVPMSKSEILSYESEQAINCLCYGFCVLYVVFGLLRLLGYY